MKLAKASKRKAEPKDLLAVSLDSPHVEVINPNLDVRPKCRACAFDSIMIVARQPTRKLLFAPLLAIVFLTGCGALDPVCSNDRPKPVLTSLAPDNVTLTDIDQGLLLTLTGSQFYSSSVVLWNNGPLGTTFVSSTQLQTTITTTQISSPGTGQIVVQTPSLSGDPGCDSGDSAALVFTVADTK